MGRSQREKGKRGERELAAKLTELFGEKCRRGQQYCGAAGDADVVGLEGVHVESKRVETFSLYSAMEQADSDKRTGDVPVVCHRRNGKDWVAVVYLKDLPKLVEVLNRA